MLGRNRKKMDINHYLPLVGIFTAGFLAFWLFSYDNFFQAGAIVSVAIAHVIWGVVHHYIHKDLTISVVCEYIVVSLFGLAVILSLIF